MAIAGNFWDDWQRKRDAQRLPGGGSREWVDWADHPRILELIPNPPLKFA